MSIGIVTATKALRIRGISFEGCPIIVRDDALEPIPSRWLTTIWQANKHDTAWTYAERLQAFLSYIEGRSLAWWEVNADDIELLQTRMQLAGYAADTVNLTSSAVASFYRWAAGRGFIAAKPFVIRSRSQPEPAGALPDVAVRPMRTIEEAPRYLTKEQFDQVLAHIPSDEPEVVRRTELAFQCGRYMGLRRKEVAGLHASAFTALTSGPVEFINLNRQSTKGVKARLVPVPAWLVHEIKVYAEVYRDETIARACSTRRSYKPPPNLFLTLEGVPLTREYITHAWATATKLAGIPSRFHMNRHWFGTVMVASLEAAGHPDALRRVAEMMGHSDIRTTRRYVHRSVHGDLAGARAIESGWDNDADPR